MENQSPRYLYEKKLAVDLVEAKKQSYRIAWEERIQPQILSGKLFKPEQLDSIRNHYEENLLKLSSPLDLPYNVELLRIETELYDILDLPVFEDLRRIFQEKVADIFVGYYPTDDINALVMRTAPDSYLVLVNEGVMRAVYYLSILMLSATRLHDDVPDEEIFDTAYIRSKLSAHFQEFLENGRFPGERELFLNPEKMQLVNRISHFSYAFVVAHEFAHIIHSDLSERIPRRFMLADTSLETFDKKKDEELQADLLAFQWLQYLNEPGSSSKQNDQFPELIHCGIWVFYKAATLLEELYQFRPSTHPSAAERESFLHKNGWNGFDEEAGLLGKLKIAWESCKLERS
jgi:hypothetical protein